jgi:hypothetical protein
MLTEYVPLQDTVTGLAADQAAGLEDNKQDVALADVKLRTTVPPDEATLLEPSVSDAVGGTGACSISV